MAADTTRDSGASERDEQTIPAPERTDQSGMRVLLAEDDSDLREALLVALRQSGYRVEAVGSGIALLNRLAAAILDNDDLPADAIVTDVRMPGCNGLNIIEGLYQNGRNLPVIIISAFGDDRMRERVARIPGAVLLEKPFTIEELRGRLAEVGNC